MILNLIYFLKFQMQNFEVITLINHKDFYTKKDKIELLVIEVLNFFKVMKNILKKIKKMDIKKYRRF